MRTSECGRNEGYKRLWDIGEAQFVGDVRAVGIDASER